MSLVKLSAAAEHGGHQSPREHGGQVGLADEACFKITARGGTSPSEPNSATHLPQESASASRV